MATVKANTFSSMINEYLVYSNILMEAFKDQNWLLQNANIKEGWLGGTLIVPFQQSYPSSVQMGGLTTETDIDNATYIRGSLSGYQEMWGSLFFNSRDLLEHNSVSEKNFLKLLPDQIDQMTRFMKQSMSIAVLNSGQLDGVTSTYVGANDGEVDSLHPERFMIGQKLRLVDTTGPTTAVGYVRTINKDTGVLTLYSARTGGAVVDMTGLDSTTEIFTDDASGTGGTNKFGSLKDMLLPAYAGGSDTFAGQTKTDSPFTQAVLYDAGGANGITAAAGGPGTVDWGGGSEVKANRVLDLIFDAYRKGLQRGAEPDTFIMSYKHYSAALLALEKNSGAFKNVGDAVSYAGYSSITVGGVVGSVTLVAIREMNDDCILGIKKEYFDFHTNKGFKVQISPDGLRYYTIRNTTGYVYITDTCFYGDFLYRHPWTGVGIHNINNYNPTDFT